MRRFSLLRKQDITGISGTGLIAEGVMFRDKSCVMRWLGTVRSTVYYDGIEDLVTIHGHNGATTVEWIDE